MRDEAVFRIRARRVPRLVVMLAMLAGAAPAFAQDLRSDEGPEQERPFSAGAPRAAAAGLLSEPRLLTSAINAGFDKYGETATPSNGFYMELSNMITGSGFVSIGPGFRRQLFNKNAFVDVSAAISWRMYNMVQGRFELPDLAGKHLSLGTQVMWQDQTQINYFGVGPDSSEANQSQYRMQSVNAVAYASVKPVTSLTIGAEYGFLRRPDILSPGGTFKPVFPTTGDQFPIDPGVAAGFQPNFLHGELSIASDTRDHRSRPTTGGVYRAALTTFADRTDGTFTFRQYEAEGAQFVPVMKDRDWVLAFHGWGVVSDVPQGHDVPFYLLPSLGGNNTLRAYHDYRFHDRNLVVVSAESRWALFTHLDGAIFVDAGNVAARAQDLNLRKTSYGAGIRLHTDKATFARADVAYGAEGWHFIFRTSDPFRLARLTRRVAAVPFVP